MFGVETSKVGSVTDKWDPFVIFFFFLPLSPLILLSQQPLAPVRNPPPPRAAPTTRARPRATLPVSLAASCPAPPPPRRQGQPQSSRACRGRSSPGPSTMAPGAELAMAGHTGARAELAMADHDGARGGALLPWPRVVHVDLCLAGSPPPKLAGPQSPMDLHPADLHRARPWPSLFSSPRRSSFRQCALAARPTWGIPVREISRDGDARHLMGIFACGMSSTLLASQPNTARPRSVPSHPTSSLQPNTR